MPKEPLRSATPNPARELFEAIHVHKDLRAVELLLAQGADPSAPPPPAPDGPPSTPPILVACIHEQPAILRTLIQAGADVDARDLHGVTAAMIAAANEHDDCLRILIEYGCDLTAREFAGQTALHVAASRGRDLCLSRLVAAGAELDALDFEVEDHGAWTPSMWAASRGQSKCLALLAQAGADLGFVNASGCDAAQLARDASATDCTTECEKIIEAWSQRKALDDCSARPPLSTPGSMRI